LRMCTLRGRSVTVFRLLLVHVLGPPLNGIYSQVTFRPTHRSGLKVSASSPQILPGRTLQPPLRDEGHYPPSWRRERRYLTDLHPQGNILPGNLSADPPVRIEGFSILAPDILSTVQDVGVPQRNPSSLPGRTLQPPLRDEGHYPPSWRRERRYLTGIYSQVTFRPTHRSGLKVSASSPQISFRRCKT
jgi:hypothetical protein